MPTGSRNRPDILLVVLDCLRAEDFPGGASEVDGMPFARRLMGESVVFPRAASPAPWTIPSHASLFSGLYPWESQVHAYHSLGLDPQIPTLPEMLRPQGYESISLAANAFIGPRFGLIRGFDTALWGGWWEAFLRTPRTRAPNRRTRTQTVSETPVDRRMEWLRDGPLGALLRKASQLSFRFPYALDTGSRFLQGLRNPQTPRPLSHAPWIEPELDGWLQRQKPDRPVFVFVNLMDTHEPYYPDPEYVTSFRQWWRLARVRQDHNSVKGGLWKPRPEDLRALRELYRQMVRHLDERLARIVGSFQAAGRWDNTLAIVTSDHGQSLGEHETMFHSSRLDEQLLRIPLWVRFPGGDQSGARAAGWASLIDIAPTILHAAGADIPAMPSAVQLTSLLDADRPAPAYSMADGLVWDHVRRKFSVARERQWDRPMVAAYQDDRKVIFRADPDEVSAFDVRADPREERDLWPSPDPTFAVLAGDAAVIARRIQGTVEVDPELENRLRSWGYI